MNLTFVPVFEYFDSILKGLWITLILVISSGVLCVLGGMFIATTIKFANKFIAAPLKLFIWFIMGTPLLLQLYFLFFGLGQFGILIPTMLIGIVGLGLHYAAYNADVFRAALEAVTHGQYEAARSLGFGHYRTIFFIIVPQALFRSIPQMGNNLIIMVKDSSILSILGIYEVVLQAQQAISFTFRPFEFYITVAIIFYIINLFLEYALNRYEKRTSVRL